MSRRFVFLPPSSARTSDWADSIRAAVPDLDVVVCSSRDVALSALRDAHGAFGTMDPELLAAAGKLEWLNCSAAGPSPSFYFPELVASSVTVTNMRGIYSDHISVHIMSFVLAFARGLHFYLPQQFQGNWTRGGETGADVVHLPDATAVIIGVGGIGGATAEQCSHFGMRVIGVDAQYIPMLSALDKVYPPERLGEVLCRADAVIIETQTSLEELEIGIQAAKKAGASCIIGSMAYDMLADESGFMSIAFSMMN